MKCEPRGLLLVLAATVPAMGQARVGSAESYRIQVQMERQEIARAQGERLAEEAAAFADVKDANSFAKAAVDAHWRYIQSLYSQREKIRTEKAITAKDRKSKIEQLNAKIIAASDPSRAILPELTSAKIITMNPKHGDLRVVNVIDNKSAIVHWTEALLGGSDQEFWL